MKIIVFPEKNTGGFEMDYPGIPEIGNQIWRGQYLITILSVKKLDAGEDEIQYEAYTYEREPEKVNTENDSNNEQDKNLVNDFLDSLGSSLSSMSPKDLLIAFFDNLVKSGIIDIEIATEGSKESIVDHG